MDMTGFYEAIDNLGKTVRNLSPASTSSTPTTPFIRVHILLKNGKELITECESFETVYRRKSLERISLKRVCGGDKPDYIDLREVVAVYSEYRKEDIDA